MPQAGTGIIPANGPILAELEATTRRAYIPSLFVQLYQASPLFNALMDSAFLASGGLSPVTAPVQGNSMVNGQWTDYSGAFNQPVTTPGIQNAEFNLKAFVTTIPFLGFEGLVQDNYSVVPLIDGRMNDAASYTIQQLATALYTNVNNNQQLIGLPGAIDDGTQAATYGGIARSTTNTSGLAWWQSSTVSNSGGAVTPTRNLMFQYINQVTKKNGEMPKMGVMGIGTWNLLAQDFTPQERYVQGTGGYPSSGGESLFTALMVGTVPFYCDPYCPEGVLYLLNTDYINLYVHEKAAFHFTGFVSQLPNNQFGYIGAILTLLELVNVKPQSHGKFLNLAFTNI